MRTKLWGWFKPLVEGLFAALLGFGIGAVLMLLWKYDPVKAYLALFQGAFGDFGSIGKALSCLLSQGIDACKETGVIYGLYELTNTLTNATPLILTGLTFAIGIRAGLFNIGAEGQVYIGAMAAVAASLFSLPPGLHVLVSILFALIAGALWSLPVALLKATRGVHEVISTIMLNWVGRYLAYYLIATALVDPNRAEKSISIAQSARLLPILPGMDLTASLLVSVLFAGIIYWILWQTALGYEIRAVGLNPDASRYGGIRPTRTMIASFVLGGLAAGLAGATQILGRPPTYALYEDLSNVMNLGFDGIAVALIGRNHPLGAIVAAIFMGGLSAGSNQMQIAAQVPLEMVRVVQGAIILTLAIPELLSIFKIFRRKRG
ncbi:ABC transporter permease [Candidatus Acetothermia bacterium]|nr:ABC transporter permease [Candidatus Acetothermia bacterium]